MEALKEKKKLRKFQWIHYFDEIIEKNISDWENAKVCDICKKKIVYVCELSDGSLVGRDCAARELGIKQCQIDEVVFAESQEKKNRESWAKECLKSAVDTPQEAIEACRKRNTSYLYGRFEGHCWVARFGQKFYAVPRNCSSQLYSADEILVAQ